MYVCMYNTVSGQKLWNASNFYYIHVHIYFIINQMFSKQHQKFVFGSILIKIAQLKHFCHFS